MITNVLNEKNILLDIYANDKQHVLNLLLDSLKSTGKIYSRSKVLEDIYIRESQGLTGLEDGLAIPHGKSKGVKETSIAIARLKNPIKWETLDDKPVDLVILFAVTENDRCDTHINILSKVAGNLAEDENIEILKKVNDKKTIIKTLEKEW